MLKLAPPVSRRAAIAQLPEVTPARGTRARPRRADAGLRPARLLRRRQRRHGARARAPRAGRSTRRALPRCCGALQLHAGVEQEALELAKATIAAYEDFEAVAVNVAGCGSAMKDYAHLLSDDPEWADRAAAFSARVKDVTELLADVEPQAPRHPLPLRVAYHDACHLAHAQGVRAQPRALLRGIPELELLEPADWELCCGSAGIYNLVEPEAAAELGARKARNLVATGADVVAAGNPGCALQIAAHLGRARAADPPPDDPAGPLDQRNPPMKTGSRPDRSRAADPHAARRSTSSASCTRASAAAAVSCSPPGARGRPTSRAARRSTSSPRRASSARATGRWRRRRRDYLDRRVEITGPTDRKLVINALNSGARGLHGRLRGRELADLGQPGRGPRQPDRRDRGDDRVRLVRGQGVPARRRDRDAAGPPARLAPAREAPRRSTGEPGVGRARRLRPARVPRRPPARRAGARRLLLPAEAGAPPRGAALERRLQLQPRTSSGWRAAPCARPS